MIKDLVTDLASELRKADENFDSNLLEIKITNAIREVKAARNYPSTYTEDMIDKDMQKYYSKIRNIVLYDYSHIGAYGENQRNEDGINRVYVERSSLFNGIIPISRL